MAETPTMVRVEIPGKPVPKARPRMNKTGFVWTPSSTHEEGVAKYFLRYKGLFPKGPVKLRAEFHTNPRQRSDNTNLIKLVEDAITRAGVWGDDHQVTDVVVSRRVVPIGEERTIVFISRPADWAATAPDK